MTGPDVNLLTVAEVMEEECASCGRTAGPSGLCDECSHCSRCGREVDPSKDEMDARYWCMRCCGGEACGSCYGSGVSPWDGQCPACRGCGVVYPL